MGYTSVYLYIYVYDVYVHEMMRDSCVLGCLGSSSIEAGFKESAAHEDDLKGCSSKQASGL